MILDIVVEPDGGVFYAHCPTLPGLHVAGDTEKEALRNAGDALSAYMTSLIKHGDPLPHSLSEARRFQAQGSCGGCVQREAQPAEEEGPYDNPYPHGPGCKCGPRGERGEPGISETTYDCGLDESCLDEDGFVKAGGHPLHEPDQEDD